MLFVNKGETIKVRVGTHKNYRWRTLKKGDTMELSEDKGKKYGLEKVNKSDSKSPKVTEGKAGTKKVETKQIEKEYTPDDLFLKELEGINGIGPKTARDIVTWGTKEKLIEAIKLKAELPFRDDIEEKLREKYG
jgi:hypothetical protein